MEYICRACDAQAVSLSTLRQHIDAGTDKKHKQLSNTLRLLDDSSPSPRAPLPLTRHQQQTVEQALGGPSLTANQQHSINNRRDKRDKQRVQKGRRQAKGQSVEHPNRQQLNPHQQQQEEEHQRQLPSDKSQKLKPRQPKKYQRKKSSNDLPPTFVAKPRLPDEQLTHALEQLSFSLEQTFMKRRPTPDILASKS